MSEFSYTILGTSSGLPQSKRGSSGYVIKTGESLALIDCGGSVCQAFMREGFDPVKLDRIFVTHSHPDHVVELPLLIQMLNLGGRKHPVDLYLPEEFVDPFERMLEAMYIFRSRLPYELRIVGYEEHFKFNGPFELRAIANTHLKRYAPFVAQLGLPSRLQCFSYDIEIRRKRIFHSGDIGGFEDIESQLVGYDYAVLEAAHLDMNRLFEFLKVSNVGWLIITHLVSEGQGEEIEGLADSRGVKNLIVARDGFRIEL
jgi:ribonuclease BN (tRNA processing enzyme)